MTYSKDNTLDLTKYVVPSDEHLEKYEKQGKEIREEQKRKNAEKK